MNGRLRTASALLLGGLISLGGCADPFVAEGGAAPIGSAVEGPWPAPDGSCRLGATDPTRLLLTTTDFSTGALTVVDTAALEVTPDVAVGSTDAIPFYDPQDERVVVVHRFGLDYLDVLSDPGFAALGQYPVVAEGSANPQGVAFDRSGHAWVSTLGSRFVRRLSLSLPPGSAEQDTVDLSAFADSDGNPEASAIVACGDQIYVGVQRLDDAFEPVDVDMLVALDRTALLGVDLDADAPGGQGLPLLGPWLRQLRLDPSDASGQTLLALTTGIERIDVAAGTVAWALPPETLTAVGLSTFRQPQSFAVSADGRAVYLAAYEADFSEVRLWHVGLDGAAPATPTPFADGMDSVERTLERVGDRLFYGSSRVDAPGLWVFDLTQVPPSVVDGPLPTGLPPYSMVALP